MFRRGRGSALVATLTAVLLGVAACGGGGGSGDGQQAGGSGGGTFSMDISEPEHLGPPSMCYDTSCSEAVDLLYTGLVDYNAKTKTVENDIAKSIKSQDSVHWTIELKKGFTFHNGEPVNADAFIRAWNYAAYGPNAVETNFFYTQFKGYEALNPSEGEPETKKLSGLEKVNDYKFKVTLTEPFGQFKTMLAFTGFSPASEECLSDPKACDENPIGNGPYTLGKWEHDQQVTLHRWDKYQGKDKGNAETINLKIYRNTSTAFQDFRAGNLDVLNVIDPSRIQQVQQMAGDRVISKPGDSFTYLGIGMDQEGYTKKVRHALSLAINRKLIGQEIFSGIRFPAKSLIPPVVKGGQTGACEYCTYDPERAKKLMKEAGGPPEDTITIYFNAGGGHEEWTQAIGNMWKKTFGIDYKLQAMDWDEYLTKMEEGGVDGPFRLGWSMDYPAALNYLKPMYLSGAGSNYTGYSNEKVDQLINKCQSTLNEQKALQYCHQAEKTILEDMPTIPIYFYKELKAYNDTVTNVNWDGFHQFRLSEVKVTG